MTVATNPERTQELLELIGDPRRVAAELDQVQQSAAVLSSDHPRLIDRYPERWVALHAGVVVADASTLDELLAGVVEQDPESRSHVLVRFIARQQQTLIL